MTYLTSNYDAWGVVASILIGVLASYVALDLAKRLHQEEGAAAVSWWICGSLVMGTGIWSMHFVGMLAFSLPIALGYTVWLTFLSWLAAVTVSAIALAVASRGVLTYGRLAAGSALMGGGICAMHYTGMAAASFPVGAVCLSAASLSGGSLGTLVIVLTISLLALTLCVSLLDVRRRLTQSLKSANEQLQLANHELHKRALVDPLTALPNRVLLEDRLAQAVARRERASKAAVQGATERLAVLFLDLDGFKPVNDSYGHAAGDQVLVEVARGCVRPAARWIRWRAWGAMNSCC